MRGEVVILNVVYLVWKMGHEIVLITFAFPLRCCDADVVVEINIFITLYGRKIKEIVFDNIVDCDGNAPRRDFIHTLTLKHLRIRIL